MIENDQYTNVFKQDAFNQKPEKPKSVTILSEFGFSSFSQIKSFDDIRDIDSKEAFIRVCVENGYEVGKLPEDWKMLSGYVSAGLITAHLLFTISN